ncbi:MAG: hypothetical protein IKF59_13435, partial [Lachnospiraceae bacterium]|nr:hypothetical protein [Lachnospiraceae bacterium]
ESLSAAYSWRTSISYMPKLTPCFSACPFKAGLWFKHAAQIRFHTCFFLRAFGDGAPASGLH